MTFTIKQKEVGEYYIAIYQEKYESTYRVEWCWSPNGTDIYRTLDDRAYTNLKSAERRFNTLVKRSEGDE